MAKFIKVTNTGGNSVYVNVDHISYFSEETLFCKENAEIVRGLIWEVERR